MNNEDTDKTTPPPPYMTNQDIVRSFEATKEMYNGIMLQLGMLKGQLESQAASTSASILFITQRLRSLEKTEPQASAQLEAVLRQDLSALTPLELADYVLDLQAELDRADGVYDRVLDGMERALKAKHAGRKAK